MIRAQAHFGKSNRQRLAEWHSHQRELHRAREESERRRKVDADDAADADLLSTVAAIAATDQLAEFTQRLDAFDERLDGYHEASVEALIEAHAGLDDIRERLDEARRDLNAMRSDAYEMEDGTMIFLSQDATWAIDVEGAEVDIETVPVDAVPPSARIAERYQDKLEQMDALIATEAATEERIEAIHEFDNKRAEAAERSGAIRTQIEDGDISTEELKAFEEKLEDMDAELLKAMPESVRMNLDGVSREAGHPSVGSELDQSAENAPASLPNPTVEQAIPPAAKPLVLSGA